MISSIQLREDVKLQLARYKERDNESFEEIILNIMQKITFIAGKKNFC